MNKLVCEFAAPAGMLAASTFTKYFPEVNEVLVNHNILTSGLLGLWLVIQVFAFVWYISKWNLAIKRLGEEKVYGIGWFLFQTVFV